MEQRRALAGNPVLIKKLVDRMSRSPERSIRFRDFMEICLYDPEAGYYMSERSKIGKEGDFYTSSQVGSVLGDILARYIGNLAGVSAGPFTVTEWGAGTGRLARQILDGLRSDAPAVYERLLYCIVEKSPHHRRVLRETLEDHRSKLEFRDLDSTDSYAPGLVFSNELLDAFPVHRVRQGKEGLMELHVGWNSEEDRFEELERPCEDSELNGYLAGLGIGLAEGQTADISLDGFRWISNQAALLADGTPLLTIDYGDRAEELYGPHRMAGTLMCYKEHRAYDNPYIHAGEQDITAHVDFTGCILAGTAAGLASWRLLTQKQFLVENGILELLQAHDGGNPFSPAAKRNRAVRQLLLSDQMSELFKVLIQHRLSPEN